MSYITAAQEHLIRKFRFAYFYAINRPLEMKYKRFFAVFSLAIALLLSACEGNTDREWIIQNQSSNRIEVQATLISTIAFIPKEIQPAQERSIFINSERGGNSSVVNTSDLFAKIIITNSLGDTLKKDPLLQTSWETDVEETKKVPSNYKHEYRFTITDSDF